MGTKNKPHPSELMPIDWERVETDYRAGILSVREIGARHGLSHTAIQKRAKKFAWARDLKAKIQAKADELVSREVAKGVVATAVATGRALADVDEVMANGAMLAAVRLSQRADIAKARSLVAAMLQELEATTANPVPFFMVYDALAHPDEPAIEALRDMARLVQSLPQRVAVVKSLAEAMHRLIGAEREAFGMDTKGGTDGIPMALIRDYTGRGDPDSPFFGRPVPEAG